MKFYKAKLGKKPVAEGGGLIYPSNHQTEVYSKFVAQQVYPDTDGKYVQIAVPDKNVLGTNLSEYTEITEAAARENSETKKGEYPVMKIQDDGRIESIKIKLQRGETLTTEDEEALNPANKRPGFNTKSTFVDWAKTKE